MRDYTLITYHKHTCSAKDRMIPHNHDKVRITVLTMLSFSIL